MLVALYEHKNNLKKAVGRPLRYQETSMFGYEYQKDGVLTVVGPYAYNRKWFAKVTMKDGLIAKVE